MSRSRWFVLVAFAALVLASPSLAAVPDPVKSTTELTLVGDSNGMLIGDGYRVTVRDINNIPIAASNVQLIFAGTVRPYTAQVAPAVVACPIISKFTDAAGNVMFQARFGGFANAAAVQVRADGVVLAAVRARSTDLNADGTTSGFDLSTFRFNFLNNPAAPETDYNEDGITSNPDFNIFRTVFLNDIPGVPCP